MHERILVVASLNPVKQRAAEQGDRRMFPDHARRVVPVSVPSGVADQPRSDGETRSGAENRARAAAEAHPEASVCFGIEGGVADDGDDLVAFAWVVAIGSGDDGIQRVGRSRSATFTLPAAVTALVRAGKELGEADDIVFGQSNSKQQSGAVGLLTGDAVDRAALYEMAVVLALIPLRDLPQPVLQ